MLNNIFIYYNQICFTKKFNDMLLIYIQILINIYEKADIYYDQDSLVPELHLLSIELSNMNTEATDVQMLYE